MEEGEVRRAVLLGEPLFRRLQVRIAAPTPPDVAARVGALGADLRQGLAGAAPGHGHTDAGGALEGRHHRPAPLLLHGAGDDERALRAGRRGDDGDGEGRPSDDETTGAPGTPLRRCGGSPRSAGIAETEHRPRDRSMTQFGARRRRPGLWRVRRRGDQSSRMARRMPSRIGLSRESRAVRGSPRISTSAGMPGARETPSGKRRSTPGSSTARTRK